MFFLVTSCCLRLARLLYQRNSNKYKKGLNEHRSRFVYFSHYNGSSFFGCNLLVPLAKEQSLMQCCVSMVQMEKFIFQAWL